MVKTYHANTNQKGVAVALFQTKQTSEQGKLPEKITRVNSPTHNNP